MSVHLPVLFRNETSWKESMNITSQHREKIATAQKVEGALFGSPLTSPSHHHHNNNHNNSQHQESSAFSGKTPSARHSNNNNNKPIITPRSTNNRNNKSNNDHQPRINHTSQSSSSRGSARKRDLSSSTGAKTLNHFFLTHVPSASPTSANNDLNNTTGAHHHHHSSSTTLDPLQTLSTFRGSTANTNNTTTTSSRNHHRHHHSRGHSEVAFGHTYSSSHHHHNNNNNRRSSSSSSCSSSSSSSSSSPMRPHFPSNPVQRHEKGEGPSPQTSSVRPRMDRAIWPAPSSSSATRKRKINIRHHYTFKNDDDDDKNSDNNSRRERSLSPFSTKHAQSEKQKEIMSVRNVASTNKILASIQQHEDRYDAFGNEEDDDEEYLLEQKKKQQAQQQQQHQQRGSQAHFSSQQQQQQRALQQQQQQKQQQARENDNKKRPSFILQQMLASPPRRPPPSIANEEKLRAVLRNEVLFDDEELALRQYQSNLASATKDGLLTDEQQHELLDYQQKLLYGSTGYLPGVTGPRQPAGSRGTGAGSQLASPSAPVHNASGGQKGGVGGISADLVADPSNSPLPFVSVFNGLFPSVTPQTFLTRYIQWVASRRPKSPKNWSSFLPSPEDPQHMRARIEKVGMLYVHSVSHEKDLFKSFLSSVSESSAQFTDGFVRSVLRCLLEYEPVFFDKIVKTVADVCRREQLMNPQPRSLLSQTKTLMREAEIQLRERQRKEEMQNSTLKSHSLGSMMLNASVNIPSSHHQQAPSVVTSQTSTSPAKNNNNRRHSSILGNPASSSGGSHHHQQPPSVASSSSKRNSPTNQDRVTVLTPHNSDNKMATLKRRTSQHQAQQGQNQLLTSSSSPTQATHAGGGGVTTLFTIKEIFRAFTDASFTPISLRNIMVVCDFFDPHHIGAVPHYALTQKNFLLKFFQQAVTKPTLSQQANWENLLDAFETVRQETEDFVNALVARERDERAERRRRREQAVREKREARKKSIMEKYSDNLQQQQLQLQLLQQELDNEEQNNQQRTRQQQGRRRGSVFPGSSADHNSNNDHNNNHNATGGSNSYSMTSMVSEESFEWEANGSFSTSSPQTLDNTLSGTSGYFDNNTTTNNGSPAATIVSATYFPTHQLPPFAWFLSALIGPKVAANVVAHQNHSTTGGGPGASGTSGDQIHHHHHHHSSHTGKVYTPLEMLKALFAKHYDTMPPPVPVSIADFRHLLLCDDRVVTVLQNYTIPECGGNNNSGNDSYNQQHQFQ